MATVSSAKKQVTKRAPKTLKEKRFVKLLPTASSVTQAVIDAGYEVSSRFAAAQIGYENMKKLDMGVWYHEAGLSLEVIAQNTARIALTAKKRDQFSGEMYDDNPTQLAAMKYATDLMGMGKNDVTNIQVNVAPILASSSALPGDDSDQESTQASETD